MLQKLGVQVASLVGIIVMPNGRVHVCAEVFTMNSYMSKYCLWVGLLCYCTCDVSSVILLFNVTCVPEPFYCRCQIL